MARQRGSWSKGWKARSLVVLIGMAPVLLVLFGASYFIATSPYDMTWVRWNRGPWTLVPTWQVQLIALPPLLCLCGLTLWWFVGGMVRAYRVDREARRIRAASAIDAATLMPGEVIRWQGKQGWRSMTRGRLAAAGVALLGLVGILLLLWWIGGRDIDPLLRVFLFVFALFTFAGPLGAALLHGPEAMQRLWYDLFGTMAVTDRRVIWIAPGTDDVYREIEGDDLIHAGLVEGDDARGWIALVERRGTGNVNEIDVHGVPQPMVALSVLHGLIGERAMAAG